MKNQLAPLSCAIAVVVLLAACGHDPTPEKQEHALRQRVEQWWTARQQRDHDAMYQLYEPAYRARVDRAGSLRESLVRTRFDILTYELQGIECETPTRAKVKITLTFLHPPAGGPLPGRVEETWLLMEGKWFKEYQPITPPFPKPAASAE